MKIVMVTAQWLQTTGGPTSHVYGLSTQLRKLGHSVFVLSPESSDGSISIGEGFPFQSWKIFRSLTEIKPDIVHIHGRIHFIPAIMVYKMFSRKKCKMVFSFHTQPYFQDFIDVSPKGRPNYPGIQKHVAKWLIHKCDEITSCSHSLIDNLNNFYNMEIEKYTVLYTGTELSPIDLQKLQSLKDDLAIGACYPILTSIGVFSWDWKVAGHKICIEAISNLKDKHPDIRLLIVGRGRFEEYLRSVVRERELEKYVIFLGYSNSLREVLEIADIYVHMALNEAMGLSLVEAMHASKAIIVANRGGLPELIINNVTGIVIEPTADDLATSVDHLLRNDGVRCRLANDAFSFAKECLTLEAFTKKQLSIYTRPVGQLRTLGNSPRAHS